MDLAPGEFSDIDISGAFSGLGDLVKSAAGVYFDYAGQQMKLENQRATLDINRTYADASAQIARAQAQGAVLAAQRNAAYGYGFIPGQSGLDQTFANLNTRISGLGSTEKIMLWLAVAGVAVAIIQLKKG